MNSPIDPHQLVHENLEKLGIPIEHSSAALAETDGWLNNDGLDDPALSEMRHLPFVTIDNEDSRDLDQALYIERQDDGYRLMYALADASYYISPGSALFDEALQRGATFYTPVLAAAMLPTALSEGLISLNPQVDRRALVFELQLNSDAKVLHCQILRARIKSHAKLSYDGVQQWLDADTTDDIADQQPYHSSLRLLKKLGSKLIEAAELRGVVKFDRTETKISVSGTPPQLTAALRHRVDTERYNEQISLLCNMQGAELLLGLAGVTDVVQAIYRVHEAPVRKNLNRLQEILDAMADAQTDSEAWRWQAGVALAQFVSSLPSQPEHRRRVRAVQRQIMQAQRASTFTPEAGEHHAIKACSYARFTSPMREVVGIYTHKELLEALTGKGFDNDADHALREQVIDAANTAKQKQRQLDKQLELATLQSLFLSELDTSNTPWHTGTIVGIRSDKLYINLDDMAVDIKIYREDLEHSAGVAYIMHDASAVPVGPQAHTWYLGQGIDLQAQAYVDGRKRFVFNMKPLDVDISDDGSSDTIS